MYVLVLVDLGLSIVDTYLPPKALVHELSKISENNARFAALAIL